MGKGDESFEDLVLTSGLNHSLKEDAFRKGAFYGDIKWQCVGFGALQKSEE